MGAPPPPSTGHGGERRTHPGPGYPRGIGGPLFRPGPLHSAQHGFYPPPNAMFPQAFVPPYPHPQHAFAPQHQHHLNMSMSPLNAFNHAAPLPHLDPYPQEAPSASLMSKPAAYAQGGPGPQGGFAYDSQAYYNPAGAAGANGAGYGHPSLTTGMVTGYSASSEASPPAPPLASMDRSNSTQS